MKYTTRSTALVCAIGAAALSFSSLSQAQDPHRGPGHDRNGQPQQRFDNGRPGDHRGGRDFARHDHRGHDQRFHRGGYVPREYRGHQYVVNDWRGRHYAPPPRGYQYVQVGSDVALAAIATGLIASIILSN